jgi:hypothetical protein
MVADICYIWCIQLSVFLQNDRFIGYRKSDVPVSSVVCAIGSPCSALPGFLHKIRSSLFGESTSFAREIHNMSLTLVKSRNIQSRDTVVSSDLISLYHQHACQGSHRGCWKCRRSDNLLSEQSVL